MVVGDAVGEAVGTLLRETKFKGDIGEAVALAAEIQEQVCAAARTPQATPPSSQISPKQIPVTDKTHTDLCFLSQSASFKQKQEFRDLRGVGRLREAYRLQVT